MNDVERDLRARIEGGVVSFSEKDELRKAWESLREQWDLRDPNLVRLARDAFYAGWLERGLIHQKAEGS